MSIMPFDRYWSQRLAHLLFISVHYACIMADNAFMPAAEKILARIYESAKIFLQICPF
jgi:hypothetical protein